ncbi:hypothetical protein Adt_06356 [Abeliophyllum distichum]|uniref:Uncharacterized protein n=1 Tax=Abeliophyllum distichum TaxID=126358 RepID=A0ABD1V6P5_9LAMI
MALGLQINMMSVVYIGAKSSISFTSPLVGLRSEWQGEICEVFGGFIQDQNSVNDVKAIVTTVVGVGIDEQLATFTVASCWDRKRVVYNNDSVDTIVTPVGKDFLTSGIDGVIRVVMWDPLAFVGRLAKDV